MSTFAASLTSLRTAQKPARGVPAYTRYVNRPAGKVIAAAAHVVGASPNTVSWISGALSAVAVGLIALVSPSPVLGIGVALLLALGYAVDSADGQLARLSGLASPRGEWLDHVLDCAKLLSLHTAVLVSFFRFPDLRPDSQLVLLLPLVFQFAAVMTFFTTTLTDQLRRAGGSRRSASGSTSARRSLIMLPIDYGTVALTFVVFGTGWFVPLYAALAAAALAFMAAFQVRGWRELAAATERVRETPELDVEEVR